MIDLTLPASTRSSAGPEGLAAEGPGAGLADKLRLFGQFVGDWEADFTVYSPEGTKQTEKGEWHFGWVLEGRAIQDVWIIPRRSERDKEGWARSDYGTAIRFYDPEIDAWRVVWVSPPHGELLTFTGRQLGDEIVLEGNDREGSLMRWVFSKITRQSFHWRRIVSLDGGKTWRLHKEMLVRRVGPAQ